MKKFFKKIGQTIGRYLLFLISAIIKRLPYAVFRAFSIVFLFIGHCFLTHKRKLAMHNLRMAFGKEKSEAELRKIFNDCFNIVSRGMIDLIYFLDRPRQVAEKVSITGKEHLDRALEGKKGVIILSAHFGIFILMYVRMVLEGYPTNVIMRRTHDAEFEEYISNYRRELGIKNVYAFPQKQCIQQSLKVLRNNELLFILLDQHYGSEGGIVVDFFGRAASTAAGPVVFSNRTGAPILPMFIQSHGDSHEITIGPPIELIKEGEDRQRLVANVQLLTKVIEDQIRQYPHQWGGWMHQRWKADRV